MKGELMENDINEIIMKPREYEPRSRRGS